eukprot:TRINITY_DN23499_c0_g1_i4.p1 TRINITY_DN23499_c0_g1~~TRINITY_DN23499_c0_g1_i4.p1  ORF type:complete len:677 (-),score=169.77 TRINITY_DN23499_c0_g1_i4:437-2467(-)
MRFPQPIRQPPKVDYTPGKGKGAGLQITARARKERGAAPEVGKPPPLKMAGLHAGDAGLLGAMVLPSGLIQGLMDGKEVEHMGMKFRPRTVGSGAFAGATILPLATVDRDQKEVVDHMLADTTDDGELDAIVTLPRTSSLEAWCLAAFQFKTKAREAKERVKFKIQSKMAEECIKNGEVTCFIGVHQRRSQLPLYNQANPELNTLEAFEKRAAIRSDGRIAQVLTDWFFALPRSELGELQKDEYLDAACSIMKHLLPGEHESSIREAATEDWDRDSQGRHAMTYAMFEDCMFELADLWCDGIEVEDYVKFLEGVFGEVMSERAADGFNSLQRWHMMRTVLDAPNTMSRVCARSMDQLLNGGKDHREEMVEQMAVDITGIIKDARHYAAGAQGVTVVELQAFLSGTCYGPYSQWLFKDGLANFKRFAVDGRCDIPALKQSLQVFLCSDGFGREVERGFTSRAKKRTPPKSTPRPSKAVPPKMCGMSQEAPGSSSVRPTPRTATPRSRASSRGSMDPRVTPRFVQSVSPGFGPTDGQHGSASRDRGSDKMWWVNLKTVCSSYQRMAAIAGTGNEDDPYSAIKSSIFLSTDQMDSAVAMFGDLDREGKAALEAETAIRALQELLEGSLGPEEIRDKCGQILDDHYGVAWDLEPPEIDLGEFLAFYNALSMKQQDFSEFI